MLICVCSHFSKGSVVKVIYLKYILLPVLSHDRHSTHEEGTVHINICSVTKFSQVNVTFSKKA